MANPVGYYKGRSRPAIDWVIPNWLKRGNTGFVIGQPKKACKSWLLLNLAWDLSEGKPLWNIIHSKDGAVFSPPRPMRVMYFAQEDTEDDIQDRVELMIAGGRNQNSNLWIAPKNLSAVLDTKETRRPIIEALDSMGGVDLIIFDPMRRMHHLDENDSGVMSKLWELLDWFHRTYNCATIFSHHIVKPPTAKGNTFDLTSPYAARGSGDIYGGGDAFINVSPYATKGQPSTYQCENLYFVTKRGITPTPVRVRVKFDTGEVVFEGFI